MEVVKGKKIKDILLHNNNWWRFFISLKKLIRPDIITNIIKILACGNDFLNYRLYQCFSCNHIKPVFHTCKSRFCSTCGKKAPENWIKKHMQLWKHRDASKSDSRLFYLTFEQIKEEKLHGIITPSS